MLLFDAHLPAWAAGQIQADFPGAPHARLLGLGLADDERIWLVARERGLAVLSKDRDFLHVAARLGSPPKLIHFRRGNCSKHQVVALLRQHAPELHRFLEDPQRDILVLW